MAELVTKTDLLGVRNDLLAAEQRLQAKMDTLGLRLTVQLGATIVVVLGALETIQKLVK